ncbi:MAG: hypothetical protein U1A77_03885 [Pirellulales bacterium]
MPAHSLMDRIGIPFTKAHSRFGSFAKRFASGLRLWHWSTLGSLCLAFCGCGDDGAKTSVPAKPDPRPTAPTSTNAQPGAAAPAFAPPSAPAPPPAKAD